MINKQCNNIIYILKSYDKELKGRAVKERWRLLESNAFFPFF